MINSIRILTIAPYEGMKTLFSKLANDYKNVELDVFVGDLDKGVEATQQNFHSNYDIVISRGGTAKLLKEHISLPVVEIQTTAFDILRTIKLSNASSDKVAIVGFPNITDQSIFLKDVLPIEIDVFPINSQEETVEILEKLKIEKYDSVICDMITYTTALSLGLDAFLITSGIESIKSALDTAVQYCSNNAELRSQNHFFRQLTSIRGIKTVVFDTNGKLFYSTVSKDDLPIFQTLENLVENINLGDKHIFQYRVDNLIYSVNAESFVSDESQYIAFYIRISKAPLSGTKIGIEYLNKNDIEKSLNDTVYASINFFSPYQKNIDLVNQYERPILITGEEGTGKAILAKKIYLQSNVNNRPFIQIDCGVLTDKVWDYLINNSNSPLCHYDSTIFIKNMNMLNEKRQVELWDSISIMDVARGNRLIISTINNSSLALDKEWINYINQLNFYIFDLPSLQKENGRIPNIINLFLNQLNLMNEKHVLGFSREAILQMQNFEWPYNYLQFIRVMNNIFMITEQTIISSDEVKKILEKEKSILHVESKSTYNSLNLSRSLNDINKEIIQIVLDTNNGNQTRTSESLQISRTTLWRIINQD